MANQRFKVLVVILLGFSVAHARLAQAPKKVPPPPQKIVREGIAVEFTIESSGSTHAGELLEGNDATVRFKITENNTGQPISRLHPSAWIDLKKTGPVPDERQCREKVQSFLQSSFNRRADIDLNSYFILTLNHEPNISVIDPLSGFGGSKLLGLIPLVSPGEDWVMSGDQKRLFVTMPDSGQVAVIETSSWKVLTHINAGVKPTRIALQPDGKYLWVDNEDADEASDGITVIEAGTTKVVAHIVTGTGPHQIAFSENDRYAFVTNKRGGTLAVIDASRLARIKVLKVGSLPTAVAASPLSKAIYVIDEGDGDVVVVDAQRHEILNRIKMRPGLRAVRFTPDGRFGFVVNTQANVVYVFDTATNALLNTVPVGQAPDQVSFTRNFAYVRSSGDEFVSMISLSDLGKPGADAGVTRFPAGQKAPGLSRHLSPADTIVAAPEDGAVLVANPADQMIYYYMEGMAAPMGNFQNYRRDPMAVLVLDRGLRETSPGVYTATVRLNGHGSYDVPFLLDSPRVLNCFDIEVRENPQLAKPKEIPIRIEPLDTVPVAYAGENLHLRFRVLDAITGKPRSDLKDVGVLAFLAPGIWQQRDWATPAAGGVYEMNFVPPQAGVYYVFFQCPSLGVHFNQLQRWTIEVKEHRARPAPATASKNLSK
ncbi:MAG TPA: cytochrome D1 domain-containing protein [Pyrinomonadaceae bacterium]|nr:cytochrome D1 domain-containing protein [Pyrinomonadaceae bacterium]